MKRFVSILLAILLSCFHISALSESASEQLTERYAEAELLFVDGKYAEAAVIFDTMGPYLDASEMAMYCKAINIAETEEMYGLALSTFNLLGDFKNSKLMATYYTGRYYQAGGDTIDIRSAEDDDLAFAKDVYGKASGYYDQLIVFKDSLERKKECENRIASIDEEQQARIMGADEITYRKAIAFEDSGEYLKAVEIYKEIPDYKDSKERITSCETAYKEVTYTEAMTKMEEGDWATAAKLLLRIKGYKDVDTLIADNEKISAVIVARRQKTAPFKFVGDYVTFGSYMQSNSRKEKTPIEWLILDYDTTNNKALLISRYGLDAQLYNIVTPKFGGEDVTWEECSLRAWLNDEFLNNAFSEDEQSAILITDVDNSQSQGYNGYSSIGGNNTQDMIFLLSYAEANEYLGVTKYDKDNIKARVALTAYAISQGASTSDSYKTEDGQNAAYYWWLRSPGDSQSDTAIVDYSGALSCYWNYWDVETVRPVFWINLDSDYFD